MAQPSSYTSARSYALVAGVTLCTIIADQVSKKLILNSFQPGEIRAVIPDLFNLTLTFNRGAAFGLWGDLPPGWREAALGVSILMALAVVFFFLKQPTYQNTVGRVSLAGILGGALGNVIDRFTYGAVVDFLDVYYGTHHWPAFNVADSAISLGVIALILMPQKKAIPQATISDTAVPQTEKKET